MTPFPVYFLEARAFIYCFTVIKIKNRTFFTVLLPLHTLFRCCLSSHHIIYSKKRAKFFMVQNAIQDSYLHRRLLFVFLNHKQFLGLCLSFIILKNAGQFFFFCRMTLHLIRIDFEVIAIFRLNRSGPLDTGFWVWIIIYSVSS